MTARDLPREIERKYLLRGLPPIAEATPASGLVQGYLPGEAIVERLRKETSPDGKVRLLRTVKLGRGVERVEVEEEISEALFAQLWPATLGRRVHKRRHAIREGRHVFELDVFEDRELVLLEVELERADEAIDVPAWLSPWIEREVTDDPAYLNLNLAR